MHELVVIRFYADSGETAVIHLDENGDERRVSSHPVGSCPDHMPLGLAEALQEEIKTGHERFAFDAAHVGLGGKLLLKFGVQVVKSGGSVVVLNPSSRIRELLHVTRLEAVLQPCNTLGEAREYFSKR